ncbi:transcription antitermination factor NusB, partial [Leptospira ellisii]
WEVPKNVTIDEAVELTKEFESEESSRFVNGILDSILKNEIKSDG